MRLFSPRSRFYSCWVRAGSVWGAGGQCLYYLYCWYILFSLYSLVFFGVWPVAEGGWTPAGSSQALLPCPTLLLLPGTRQSRNRIRGTFTWSKRNQITIWRFWTLAGRKGAPGAGDEDRVNVILRRKAACPRCGGCSLLDSAVCIICCSYELWWGLFFSLVSL